MAVTLTLTKPQMNSFSFRYTTFSFFMHSFNFLINSVLTTTSHFISFHFILHKSSALQPISLLLLFYYSPSLSPFLLLFISGKCMAYVTLFCIQLYTHFLFAFKYFPICKRGGHKKLIQYTILSYSLMLSEAIWKFLENGNSEQQLGNFISESFQALIGQKPYKDPVGTLNRISIPTFSFLLFHWNMTETSRETLAAAVGNGAVFLSSSFFLAKQFYDRQFSYYELYKHISVCNINSQILKWPNKHGGQSKATKGKYCERGIH